MLRCLSYIFWLKAFALFAVCAVLGYLLGRKPETVVVSPKPTLKEAVTLSFYGLNKEGKQIRAKDGKGTYLNTLEPYQLYRNVGDKIKLTFTPDDHLYDTKDVEITWPTRREYLDWLTRQENELTHAAPTRSKFWHEQFDSYRQRANGTTKNGTVKNTFEYPVIFEKKP